MTHEAAVKRWGFGRYLYILKKVILLIVKEMKQQQQYTNSFRNSLFFCSPETALLSISDLSENKI